MNTKLKNDKKQSRLVAAWQRVKEAFSRFWRRVLTIVRGQDGPLGSLSVPKKIGVYVTGVVSFCVIAVTIPSLLVGDKLDQFQDWLKKKTEVSTPAPEAAAPAAAPAGA